MELPGPVLKVVKNAASYNEPKQCLRGKRLNKHKLTSVNEFVKALESHHFCVSPHESSKETAARFMVALHECEKIAQMDTVLRSRFYRWKNNFKPAQHTALSFLYKNVFSTLKKEKAFLTFFKDSELPVIVATMKDAKLGSTVLDEELEEN